MKTYSLTNIFKKFLAGLLVAYFFVFQPVIVLAKIAQPVSAPVSIPPSIPIPVPTPTPTPSSPKAVIPFINQNLIQNSSFEINNNGYPANWWKRTEAKYDNTTSHSGQASLKLTSTKGQGIYSQQYINLEPDTEYTVSYWYKTNGVTGPGVSMRYAQLSPVTRVYDMPFLTKSPQNGTKNWTRYTSSFKTPASYQSGRLDMVWYINSGTAWIDDVVLVKKNNTP